MAKMPAEVLTVLKAGQPLPDAKLDALHDLTRAMVVERGRPDSDTIRSFLAAGYTERQLLEVIVGIALKTISNYTNHVADTPLDAPLQPFAWAPVKPAGIG